jgi:glycosyltransferase involved in cell wall biosynthesis
MQNRQPIEERSAPSHARIARITAEPDPHTDRKRLRILTITNWYPPQHFGGYELSCYDVMTRLERRGHRVTVLCSDERVAKPPEPATVHEHNVRRELRLYIRDGELLRPRLRERLAIERHNQEALRAVLAEAEPDVVSVWHMGALSLGLLTTAVERGLPIVYAVCDSWLVYGSTLDRWAKLFNGALWRRALGRLVRRLTGVPTVVPDLSRTGGFCFVSDLTRRRSEEGSPWQMFPISAVVYSGIERSLFARRPASADQAWDWRLLYVGRLDPRKGIETLIRAFARLPGESSLFLFGRDQGGNRRRFESLAADLGVADRVTFGELARHELAAAFAAADVLVFPSEWEEPFGLVPIEAMACGTPVLATGTGGSAEFLRDGENCLLFRAGDTGALVEGVHRLASDPALRHRIAEGGFRVADELTADRLADVFEAWHLAAAARFRGGMPAPRPLLSLA